MAIGHISVRPHSRAQGHKVAAAVAYRCGLALTCERTGERHDFTRRAQRDDVAAYGLSGGGFESPAAFAAAVESAEKRRNSRICRDVQIALPAELDAPSRIELAEAFAAELAERYGTAACWAVHRPDRRSDQRNHHAHIILPTRGLAGDGRTFGKKLRALDDQRRGPEEITEIRSLWESRANEALIAAGQAARVHTGRTTNPEPTLNAACTAIERAAWTQRHPGQRQPPTSAVRLVTDDGVCVTECGQALAWHAAERARRAHAPEAAQNPAQAAVPVVSVPEPRPARPLAPVAAQGLAQAVVLVMSVEEPRPVRILTRAVIESLQALKALNQNPAQAVVPVMSVPEPRPVRILTRAVIDAVIESLQALKALNQNPAQAVVPVMSVEEPRPVRILTRTVESLQALEARRSSLMDELKAAREELQAARQWLTRTIGPGQHGASIPTVADSIARQRLTANVSLHESHPQRYSERPTLPKAISQLAPRAATGYTGNAFGDIPDSMNTGACRTRKGAEQAAQVLDRAIDDIAREHFDGHTDPRDYTPGWFKRSVEEARTAALEAWQAVREKIVRRMMTAAEAPEAIEIRRRRRELTIERERKARAKEERQRIARERRPQDPNQNTGPGQGGLSV